MSSCLITQSTNLSGTGLPDRNYVEVLGTSKFCICPEGNNWETFRIYESLDLGCVPVVSSGEVGYKAWYDMMGVVLEGEVGISVRDGFLVCDKWGEECIKRMSDMSSMEYEALRMGGGRIWDAVREYSRRVIIEGMGLHDVA